ncbi:uncharacterized protein RHTO_01040 [Rhodotorula toruloides NP11]|uniref:Uncharacterized protein n=1 Tax=Rhodotorula toruloides (strain NP11) TaxID=1130832 RepID=M7WW21_RHOT1|nr:uncharacterized protein RHTO_01040 [Rhodotorula toruloides NP11]EMS22286.1 hypothetical protein RHTO_01040 [Rhodotorula toruloides NP11]
MARTTGGKKKSTPSSTKWKSSSSPSSNGKKSRGGKSGGKETYQQFVSRVTAELKEEFPDWTGTQRREEVKKSNEMRRTVERPEKCIAHNPLRYLPFLYLMPFPSSLRLFARLSRMQLASSPASRLS